jgi:LmbE family N-acetylglucosaminyl deacetylase
VAVATLVFFHAHPDDESMIAAGTMAAAADAGHRVVMVVATRGEQGEPKPGVLAPGEQLGRRREAETQRSAEILGVERVHFLGYVDSGMMGEPTNDDPASFWQADVDEAATALAALLAEEGADALTIYDEWGTYGGCSPPPSTAVASTSYGRRSGPRGAGSRGSPAPMSSGSPTS